MDHPGCSVYGALAATVRFDPDLAHASEYEVRFIEESPARTRVEFEHRHFERHGGVGQSIRDSVDKGWPKLLAAYAESAKTAREPRGNG